MKTPFIRHDLDQFEWGIYENYIQLSSLISKFFVVFCNRLQQ